MKKVIWLCVIIVSINLLIFPKVAKTGRLDQNTGQFFAGISSIYLAPIWSKSYKSRIITFVPSNIGVWDSTDFNGNTRAPDLAIGIWLIFFLIPSISIFYFAVFFKKKQKSPILE